MWANYEFLFQKCSVFEIFVNEVVQKLLCIWYCIAGEVGVVL